MKVLDIRVYKVIVFLIIVNFLYFYSMKILKYFIEILFWLRIVASPTIIGCVAGFLIWKGVGETKGMLFGSIVALCGLVIGIIWATRIWKKQGTSTFMSRVNASPDLDNLTKQD